MTVVRQAPTAVTSCSIHRDWASLTRHLLAEFVDVPTRSILDELARARHANEFFELEGADALRCAELIVRHRVHLATRHHGPSLVPAQSGEIHPEALRREDPAAGQLGPREHLRTAGPTALVER